MSISTAIDGTALTLIDGKLIRLSRVRELQTSADIDKLKTEIIEWIEDTGRRHVAH
jgi:hypothetical protein